MISCFVSQARLIQDDITDDAIEEWLLHTTYFEKENTIMEKHGSNITNTYTWHRYKPRESSRRINETMRVLWVTIS